MDFSYMGHQMHGQQDSQYSEGPEDLEDELHRVQARPFQANLSGSMSSWTQHPNMYESLPPQAADTPGYNHNGDLENGHHQIETRPFQANLSGSMSSWTTHHNINDSLPFRTADALDTQHNEMGSGPIDQPQRMDSQPMSLPSASAVASTPQVDYGEVAGYMKETSSQLRMYCKQRGIQTSTTTKKSKYVELAQPVLPGVDCWALRISELREKCKAHNVAIPSIIQHDSKAVMARKLVEDDARWGL